MFQVGNSQVVIASALCDHNIFRPMPLEIRPAIDCCKYSFVSASVAYYEP